MYNRKIGFSKTIRKDGKTLTVDIEDVQELVEMAKSSRGQKFALKLTRAGLLTQACEFVARTYVG